MALPAISNNSPSAGRIAWTAFSIVWDGTAYPVAAGNTNQPYTWWEYRNGTPAVVSGATLPTLGVADLLLFLNKGGLGVLAPLTDVVEGSLIVPGTILGDAIGTNQLRSEHHESGSVTTRVLAAGAVTAEKMSIGSVTDSMVINGSFEDGTQGWEVMAGSGVADVVTGVASAGANALRLTRGTVNNLQVGTALDKAIPVTATAGRTWYVAAVAGAGSTLASGFYLRAYWYQADRVTAASTAFTDVASNQGLSTTWKLFEGKVAPPANARYMRLVVINALSGSVMYVDEIAAREVIVAAQIGDGQITTPLLAANAVKAEHIDVETLSGLVVTGLLLRTAPSGQRVELQSNRLDFFTPAGTLAGSIVGSTEDGAGGGLITLGNWAFGTTFGKMEAYYGPDNAGSVSLDTFAVRAEQVHVRELVHGATGRRVDLTYQPWTNLTAINGWSIDSAAAVRPQVMRYGDRVYFRGRFFNGTANTVASILPTWARPSRTIRRALTNNQGVANADTWVEAATNGNFTLGAWLNSHSYAEWTVE